MAIAASDRMKVRRKTTAEASWGETPSTPAMTEFNATSANFNSGKTTAKSAIIRSDRQVTDIIQTGFSATGDFGFELIYGELEWAMESLFGNTFSAALTYTGAGSTDNFSFEADPYNTIRGPSLENFVVGQWIEISRASVAANNGRWRISGVNTNTIVVNGPLSTEADSTATIKGDGHLELGTSEISYLLEQEFNDITRFKYETGARMSQLSMNFTSRAIITGTFNWMAKDLTQQATTIGDGASTVASTNNVMNASTDVGAIMKDYVTLSTAIRSIAFTVNGSLRAPDKIGSTTVAEINDGTFVVDGTLEAYFEDATLYADALAHTTVALSWEVSDDDGNRYVFTLPAVKLTGDPNAGGQNQDVMVSLAFEGYRDPASGTTIQVDKFAA